MLSLCVVRRALYYTSRAHGPPEAPLKIHSQLDDNPPSCYNFTLETYSGQHRNFSEKRKTMFQHLGLIGDPKNVTCPILARSYLAESLWGCGPGAALTPRVVHARAADACLADDHASDARAACCVLR